MGAPAWLQAAAHPLETLRKLPEATLWEDQEGVGGHLSAVWRALNALVAWQRGEAGSWGGEQSPRGLRVQMADLSRLLSLRH